MGAVISRTELARNTREIVEQVRQGQMMVVQSYGEEQIVLLDALDYRLLRAVAAYAFQPATSKDTDEMGDILRLYLDKQISLSKAAEQLGLSRYELMERFGRLGVPIQIGPATIEDAIDEVKTARQIASNT
ncbi:MAG: UPF0175 family protein [Anaerolineae bacterium]|nr:UPF0175 family protein [Anaerolineae bacterium]